MTNWRKKITGIRELMTEDEDHDSVQTSMNKIADVLEKHHEFRELTQKFRKIPEGDDFFEPVDYANKLIDEMYNIADGEKIWVE